MKKALVLVLLVSLLTLVFVSCDANIRSNIADMMGNLGGNVYIDSGLVKPDLSAVNAASDAVEGIGGDVPSWSGTTLSDFGVALDLSTATTPVDTSKPIIKPQTTAEQDAFTATIESSLSSGQSATFLAEMSTTASLEQQEAIEGTVAVFNATLEVVASNISDAALKETIEDLAIPAIDDPSKLTQGDVLLLQLMTNLVANTVTAIKNDAGTGIDETKLTSDSALAIIGDALFASQVAEQLSGVASIDFTNQLKLQSLLDNLNKGLSRNAKDTSVDLNDASDIVAAIRGILPDIIKLMGISKNGDDYTYTNASYQNFLRNQKAYRSTIEHALTLASKKGLSIGSSDKAKLDTSSLVKYFLAVLVTEHQAYWDANDMSGSQKPNEIIEAFLDANPSLGIVVEEGTPALSSLTLPDTITFPYNETSMDAYKATRSLAYFQKIITNLQAINTAIPTDLKFTNVDTALSDLLAEVDADWWNNL
ncbi:MAG: hypothetical protein AB7C91_07105 [Sphaerochaeta sp.]|uniref:hypothetical protein n=1 Tax=Sphaerochaeta sp. TaxID=1972642 RepID=UPI003D1158FE